MNGKLIDAKMKWARDGRLIEAQPAERRRLPPGQTLVRDWPVLDLGNQPNLGTRDWSLTVGGMVEQPLNWRWEDLIRQPQSSATTDIHCVTAWSRYDNRWTGLATRTLGNLVRPKPGARFVILRSFDSYSTSLALSDFLAEDAMLATHWNEEPLSREHGGPVRLVVPHLYFWKSPKWIRHIWFTDKDAVGYWEARGYHRRGDPWKQERYG